jgi:alpha-ketoglutarate-dependent taurine dioxygenase
MRAFQLTTRMAEGELVLFDNQRILHGRTAFASAKPPAPFARLLSDAR